MPGSKDQRGDKQADGDVAAERANLLLQVSAEDDLLDKSGGDAQSNKEKQGAHSMGSDHACQLLGVLKLTRLRQPNSKAERHDSCIGDNPAGEADGQVQEKIFQAIPAASDYIAHFGLIQT